LPDKDREFVVLVSHWNGAWDVFILDPAHGLIATTSAATLAEVEIAAQGALSGCGSFRAKPEMSRIGEIG